MHTQDVYTACYCEENIYCLAQSLVSDNPGVELYVVFISNPDQRVALFRQRAAKVQGTPVIWDYHVILLEVSPAGDAGTTPDTRVYDYDTTLRMPSSFDEYMEETFPIELIAQVNFVLRSDLTSLFRIVPAKVFLDTFASDRSHMLRPPEVVHDIPSTDEEIPDEYLSPPPSWPLIVGPQAKALGVQNNLFASFVTMAHPHASSRGAHTLADNDAPDGLSRPKSDMEFVGVLDQITEGIGRVVTRETFTSLVWLA